MKDSVDDDLRQRAAEEVRSYARRRAFAGRHLAPPYAELWQRFDKLFPRDKHPLINLIWLEILSRCSSWLAVVPAGGKREQRAETVACEGALLEAVPSPLPRVGVVAVKEAREISELLELAGLQMTAQVKMAATEQTVNWLPHALAKVLLVEVKRSLRGRKATQRPKALQTLEFKILNQSGHVARIWLVDPMTALTTGRPVPLLCGPLPVRLYLAAKSAENVCDKK